MSTTEGEVWFVSTISSTWLGGGETARNEWSRALIQAGKKVVWRTPEGVEKTEVGRGAVPEGVEVRVIPGTRGIDSRFPSISGVRNFLAEARQPEVEKVIFNGVSIAQMPLYMGMMAAGEEEKIVEVFHADPRLMLTEGSPAKTAVKRMLKTVKDRMSARAMSRGAAAVAVSEYIARRLSEEKITDEAIVSYPPTYADDGCESEIRQGNGKIKVLTVSRISPEKGMSFLAEVARNCQKEALPIAFSLVGRALRSDYGDRVAAEMEGAVSLVGSKVGRELCDEYKRADVLLMPSPNEAYGLVTVEAMKHAAPVVAGYTAAAEIFGKSELGQPGKKLQGASGKEAVAEATEYLASLSRDRELLRMASIAALEVGRWFDSGKLAREFAQKIL